MKKYLIAQVFLLTPFIASAAPDYSYCKIAGFAYGYDNVFIGSLAARIVFKQGLTLEPHCKSAWSYAFKRGEKLKRVAADDWTNYDNATWKKMNEFEQKINDSILKNLQLDE